MTRLLPYLAAVILLGAGCAATPSGPPVEVPAPTPVASSTQPTPDSLLPTPSVTAPFDAPVTLVPGETVLIGGELRVTLLKINDSRCKEGVVCVWEGELGAELAVAIENGGETETVILGTRTAPKKNVFLRDIALTAVTETSATVTVGGIPVPEAQEE